MRGVNSVGSGTASDSRTATTAALAPTSLAASAGDEQVTLTWAKSSADATVTGWQYRLKTDGGYGGWNTVPGATAQTTSHTVTGLENGTPYTFQVRAVNASGGGIGSPEASATLAIQKPAKPTGLSAAVGDTEIALSLGRSRQRPHHRLALQQGRRLQLDGRAR